MDEILYPRGVDSAKVIMVIETTSARGSGEPKQPSWIVTQYWSLDGKLLAERDPYLRGILSACSNASSDSM